MAQNYSFDKKKTELYQHRLRISIPTYDNLLQIIESYFDFCFTKDRNAIFVTGAGGGNEIKSWLPKHRNWHITGVDPSSEMLNYAYKEINKLEIQNQVQLINGTINECSYYEPAFDAASCLFVLHFLETVEEKQRMLNSIGKLLYVDAPFVLVTALGNVHDKEFETRLKIWESFWIANGYTDKRTNDISRKILDLSFIDEDTAFELLTKAGFHRITKFYSTGLFAGWFCHKK